MCVCVCACIGTTQHKHIALKACSNERKKGKKNRIHLDFRSRKFRMLSIFCENRLICFYGPDFIEFRVTLLSIFVRSDRFPSFILFLFHQKQRTSIEHLYINTDSMRLRIDLYIQNVCTFTRQSNARFMAVGNVMPEP